ncbi:MAG: adenylyltransferase/cytidyltransferase family protein [Selenomonadaceae bacterium]|nr:adenylyltransferase/cytidyltransferase family protein [Selenomonadaceae bacterium]
MKEYNIEIPKFTALEKKLQQESDFFNYMKLLTEVLTQYVLIITVSDTPSGSMFTSAHANAMMSALGLKMNMMNAFRMPYVAVIDHGKLAYESTSKGREEPVIVNGNLGEHTLSIYSGGLDCNLNLGFGCNALITIDGTHYFGDLGYNFFLYNVKDDYIADMCVYGAWYNSDERTLHRPTSIIKEFIANLNTGGGMLCFMHTPVFTPLSMRSEQENLIINSKFGYNMMSDKNVLQNIWNNKIFHFVNDFDTEEDLLEAITPPDAYEDIDGIMKFKDHKSNAVNTKNGIRVTTDQPQNPQRAIYIFGPCTTFGIGAKDSYTIASCLQRKLNEYLPEEKFIVYNYGFYINGIGDAQERLIAIMKSLPIQKNDIILFAQNAPFYGIPFCDLTEKSKRPHNYGDIFLDSGHFTANGNRMIADGIFDFLKKYDFFKDTKMNITNAGDLGEITIFENHENELLTMYKCKLKNFFKTNISPKVGAIVMNANPFTYGHRALVDEALKKCDYLIVFVVEEDKSDIPFKDRIMLVRENLKTESRVFIMPSGEFIISGKTFSEYFRKESLQEQKIDTSKDVILFAKEIAPCLNISIRFAGEEPTDKITRQYNEDMAKILPMYGIEFMEIKRKITDEGEVISASMVRKLVRACEYEKLETLVPPVTFEYLKRKYV